MTMTAEELLDKAAECVRCHLVHEERLARAHPVRPDLTRTTAAEDGHPYSPLLDERTIARLRELVAADDGPVPFVLVVTLNEDGTVTVAEWDREASRDGQGLTIPRLDWADFVAAVKSGGYDDMTTVPSSAGRAAIEMEIELAEAAGDAAAEPVVVTDTEPVKPEAKPRTRPPRSKPAAAATAE
jgi:hypothetical protein